jgi:hypothetical protein
MRYLRNLGFILIAAVVPASAGAPAAVCAAPAGFVDKPHPAIAPAEQLVSHSEQIVIDRAYPVVSAAMNKPLNQVIRQSRSLPGVFGDYMLTPGEFGAPGSRHIVCLTDGTSVEEEALERDGTATSGRFRYIVWNYAAPKARPIAYGVGEFRTAQIDGAHTRIPWTYSFKLKDDVFPGYLGALGRWLCRVGFLDRDCAAMRRGVLDGYKTTAEAQPNEVQPPR